jgi:hypothetical protein
MILKTLETLGQLHGYGIARRIEQITHVGRKQLAAEEDNWRQRSEIMTRFRKPSGGIR